MGSEGFATTLRSHSVNPDEGETNRSLFRISQSRSLAAVEMGPEGCATLAGGSLDC